MAVYDDYVDLNIHLEDCAEQSMRDSEYYLTKSEKEVDRLAQMRLPKEAPTGMWSSANAALKDIGAEQLAWEGLWSITNLPSYKTEAPGWLSLATTAISLSTNYKDEAFCVFDDFNKGKLPVNSLKQLGKKFVVNPQDIFNLTQFFVNTGTGVFALNAAFNICSEAFNKQDNSTAMILRNVLGAVSGHPAFSSALRTYQSYTGILDKAKSKEEITDELKLSNKHKDTVNELKGIYKVQNEAIEMLRRQLKKDQELQQFLRKTFNR